MSNSDVEDSQDKPACKYGIQCYQRNKQHFEKYKHPQKETESKVMPPAKKQRTDNRSLRQQKLSSFFSKNAPKKSFDETRNHAQIAERKVSSTSESGDKTVESTSTNSAKGSIRTIVPINKKKCQKIIEKLFLVSMPDDFFSLWEFCLTLSPRNPCDALKAVDLKLVGPFDVLNGNMEDDTESSVGCRHWRYFYDPPEFQTILKSDTSDLLHFGYYRDDPKDIPVFVGYNKAAKDVIITPVGENIFAAINWCINHFQDISNPFQKMQLSSLKNKLQNWANYCKYSLSTYTENMRKRDKKVVAKTFHRAGIVVPYDKKTELGYRPLSKTSTELVKILNQIKNSESESQRMHHMSELHEVITWANIAVDEGDFGTTLELGINLFCFDSEHFNSIILQLLTSTYKLLHRDAFASIIKAHMIDRRKGGDLSILKK